ncbi:hypothetical protein BJ741DRAFT_22226 [Chytriomyces cf. hyalinus JEL632]|nr:hypothetical protein BJ741DRAFT_22226 [Chytriomyces cf. hyalinus JEL632]
MRRKVQLEETTRVRLSNLQRMKRTRETNTWRDSRFAHRRNGRLVMVKFKMDIGCARNLRRNISWCEIQGYPETFVNESRLLQFLQHLETRPLKKRGRKSAQDHQKRTTRKRNGEVVVLERRDKAGNIIFRRPDYTNLMNDSPTNNTLSHHSIKVYVNALVNLYFWQTVNLNDQNAKNSFPYPRGPSIKSFVQQHKEEHEKRKTSSLDGEELEDMPVHLYDTKWTELAMSLLKSKKFAGLATLWIDKQTVERHQPARDWHLKDMFLNTLQNESVTDAPVKILVGRRLTKTNRNGPLEHFGLFRSKNVLECAWGWLVESMAQGYSVGIEVRVWAPPEVSNRAVFYKVKVLHDPKYVSM